MSQERDRERIDRRLATAYRELEGTVGDVLDATLVLEIVAEATSARPQAWLTDRIAQNLPELAPYQVHVLTPDQDKALAYAIQHVGDLARQLRQTYYAGFGEPAEESA